MLRFDSRNSNFNATSIIDSNAIASMSASVNEPDNSIYLSINSGNKQLFINNIAVIKNDLIAFIEDILGISEEDIPVVSPSDEEE